MSAVIDLTTRKISIYASAYDATARDAIADHLADTANPHGVDKADVGLGNVDNTSDAAKPVSDATATALALKAPLLSPALSGTPTAPTAAPGTVTTQLATAAFVQAAVTALNIPTVSGDLAAHVANTNNPHAVDKVDVGLGNVSNLAPANLPVSTATQTAINAVSAAATAAQADIDGHQAAVNNPHAVSKSQVGLSAVANLAPADLPVSTATQSAINASTAIGNAAQADIDGHQLNFANPHGVTKAQLGLSAVDNTADLAKPVSTAQQTAINAAAAIGTAAQADVDGHQANVSNPHTVTKSQVGLGNVSNLAPADLPVSTATQAAINTAAGTASTNLAAHTANVANPHAVTKTQIGLSNVANLAPADLPLSTADTAALALKAPLLSPALTGLPTAPTAAPLTATTQIATTQFTSAAVAVVAAAVAAAQADADANNTGVPYRPGDAVQLYGETKIGEPATAVPIDPAWVVVSPAGKVVRVNSVTADDPQTVTPVGVVDLEPGRIYEVHWRVQRQTNPIDPLNDSVTLGVQWLTNAKAANGSYSAYNLPLVIADGLQSRTAAIALSPPFAEMVNASAPAGTIYFRPYVDCFGDNHATDVVTIDVRDVTGAVLLPVNALSPASGATVTLTDLRPAFINNSATLAALTIRLPAMAFATNAAPLEIGFLNPVTALSIRDSLGNVISTAPASAYGPGAALLFRFIVAGWIYWK